MWLHNVAAMYQSRVGVLLIVLLSLALWACSSRPTFVARDEPWRAEEERACLASGYVRESQFVTVRSSLGGPSVCGALTPFTVSATARGLVTLEPPALLRCPMIPAVEHWMERIVMPAARYHLRANVVSIKIAGSYSCRPMNHVNGARLSEHGHANAIDVSGFLLETGQLVSVKSGWWGTPFERNFLRAVHAGSCSVFTTVLGPEYDFAHRDHFHLDLARHRDDGRICK
jgi:hypothetical protein